MRVIAWIAFPKHRTGRVRFAGHPTNSRVPAFMRGILPRHARTFSVREKEREREREKKKKRKRKEEEDREKNAEFEENVDFSRYGL